MPSVDARLAVLGQHFSRSPLMRLSDPLFAQRGIELWVKRDDLLHPVISGNKWRKLKYILNDALVHDVNTLVSMGGPWSNHLHALAFAGNALGLKTVAYIRGEEPSVYSPTLSDIQNWGMELRFVSRSEYRRLRTHHNPGSLPGLTKAQYWIPEGGSGKLALSGVAEILDEIVIDYDVLCLPCGTGTTMAGLVASSPVSAQVLGIAALKGAGFLYDEVARLLPGEDSVQWQINLDYHFGGFAKSTATLRNFIERFESDQGIELDPVYTGKMMYALYDLIERGYFDDGQRIIVLHTGGLQGKRGSTFQ